MMKVKIRKVDEQLLNEVVNTYGITTTVAKFLLSRGLTVEAIGRFLSFGYSDLRDATKMKDADKFLSVLENAVKSSKNIVIYGDYDADGIMATSIVKLALEKLQEHGYKHTVNYFVNNRFTEGYGMNKKGVIRLLEQFPDTQLIITVDNGIKAIEGISYAKEKGIDVIVSDHHGQSVGEDLPDCPVVCEKRLDEDQNIAEYFCGAELARRLMIALFKEFGLDEQEKDFLSGLIGYSGFATITDSVPFITDKTMIPANHFVAAEGLRVIREEKEIIWKVFHEQMKSDTINHDTIGFRYGPVLNAPGRILGSVEKSINAVTSTNYFECSQDIAELIVINERRKEESKRDDETAFAIVKNQGYEKDAVLLIDDESFGEGLNGLTAGHLKETYLVPAIVLSPKEDDPSIYKGSGRSIPDFNIFEALNECKDLLVGYGGHPMACGLSVKKENIPALRKRLNDLANDAGFKEKSQVIYADFLLDERCDVYKTIDEFSTKLEPFGESFEKPTACIIGNISRVMEMKQGIHHKFILNPWKNTMPEDMPVILWWNSKEQYETACTVCKTLQRKVMAIGSPQISLWNNNQMLQVVADYVFLKDC